MAHKLLMADSRTYPVVTHRYRLNVEDFNKQLSFAKHCSE